MNRQEKSNKSSLNISIRKWIVVTSINEPTEQIEKSPNFMKQVVKTHIL